MRRSASSLLKPAIAVGAAAAAAVAIARERRNPTACPYSQRYMLATPRPGFGRERLLEVLAPAPGERLLELGPGTGHYTLGVAERVSPDGRLTAVDVQQEMLDHLMRLAAERGLQGAIEPRCADAGELPFADESFDGAFLVTVLGEVGGQDRALRELRRVIAPGGRLVIGEVLLDPHFVTLRSLRRRAEAAGFAYEHHAGNPLAYVARLRAV